jgi:hypothetical protein
MKITKSLGLEDHFNHCDLSLLYLHILISCVENILDGHKFEINDILKLVQKYTYPRP